MCDTKVSLLTGHFFQCGFNPQQTNHLFHFKQFSIEDSGATMKVGTDAVLLGALAAAGGGRPLPRRILDVGTGCGILALMMAQRFESAFIDAIDIDSQTTTVAASNFLRSQWSQRLNTENTSLLLFAERHIAEHRDNYNLIISNPPYFANSLKNCDPRRTMARHSDNSLELSQLMRHASALLANDGQLAIIIPTDNATGAVSEAERHGLACFSCTDIANHHGDTPKRSILHFAQRANNAITMKYSTVALRNDDNSYSDEYRQLTQPFLL